MKSLSLQTNAEVFAAIALLFSIYRKLDAATNSNAIDGYRIFEPTLGDETGFLYDPEKLGGLIFAGNISFTLIQTQA